MKIKILRPTICQKQQVMSGQVLDVPRDEAIILVGAGKAILLKETPEKTVATVTPAENATKPQLPTKKPRKE